MPDDPAAAVKALLRLERERMASALPPSPPDWRLVLAFYEAHLEGRAPTPAEAAEAAALAPELADGLIAGLETEGLVIRERARDAPAGRVRLSDEAADDVAAWVEALSRVLL